MSFVNLEVSVNSFQKGFSNSGGSITHEHWL